MNNEQDVFGEWQAFAFYSGICVRENHKISLGIIDNELSKLRRLPIGKVVAIGKVGQIVIHRRPLIQCQVLL